MSLHYPLKVWALVDFCRELDKLCLTLEHMERACRKLGKTMDKLKETALEVGRIR